MDKMKLLAAKTGSSAIITLNHFIRHLRSTPSNRHKITMKLIATQAINTWAKAISTAFLGAFLSFSATAKDNIADVVVKDAWVRTTVPGQKGTGAFMSLTAKSDLRLVGASSAAAGVTEVHEMKMSGDVMQMRAVSGVDLPAGKVVALKPGGFHVMLLDLKTALPKDATVPLTLLFKDAKGVESKVELTVPVAATAPNAAAGGAATTMHQHKH
jgi:periplasmic copper chaperone A